MKTVQTHNSHVEQQSQSANPFQVGGSELASFEEELHTVFMKKLAKQFNYERVCLKGALVTLSGIQLFYDSSQSGRKV